MRTFYTLSVHDIVDVMLRKGHLDNRYFNESSMQRGTELHEEYQKEQGESYISEYFLKHSFYTDEFIFNVLGRADGVDLTPGQEMLDEIKTTRQDLDTFIKDAGDWHIGQAMFYAYMLCYDKNLLSIKIRLTYLSQKDKNIRKFIERVYTISELTSFVESLIASYSQYLRIVLQYKQIRNETCQNLTFPFNSLRKGQQEMMDFISNAADKKKTVYIEAPTGIGKTISTLYPLIEKFKNNNCDSIYYLTSKNSIKNVAMDTIRKICHDTIRIKAIAFSRLDQFCFNSKIGHCNPDECPFAIKYYDKLLNCIFEVLAKEDIYDKQFLLEYAMEKKICPYQFQKDLSRYCDILILDYAYVYDMADPLELELRKSKLGKAYLLVDECHNLSDRVRSMYSCSLNIETLEQNLPHFNHIYTRTLANSLMTIISLLKKFELNLLDKDEKDKLIKELKEIPEELDDAINYFLEHFKEALRKAPHLLDEVMRDTFYALNGFSLLYSELKNNEFKYDLYVSFSEKYHPLSLNILCIDPTYIIVKKNNIFTSCALFSATLSPKDYYVELLGGSIKDKDSILILPSPFDKEHLKIYYSTTYSVLYKHRMSTIKDIFNLSLKAIRAKEGHYFIFCPSFEYLDKMEELFQKEAKDIQLIVQKRIMDEDERNDFIDAFKTDSSETKVGLLVIGGIFSEGIDLIGDYLIGAIIISVGLPSISYEKDKIKQYYEKDAPSKKGFNYAYCYPGMNRVLQAAGRVIRTEEDRGFVLFIDSRYNLEPYKRIIKETYTNAKKIISPSALQADLKKFWKDK